VEVHRDSDVQVDRQTRVCWFTHGVRGVLYPLIDLSHALCVFQISDFQCPVDIKDLADADGGLSLILGAVDGSLIVLVIADPQYAEGVELVAKLPSRQLKIRVADTKPKEDGVYRAIVVGRMLKKRTSRTPRGEGQSQ